MQVQSIRHDWPEKAGFLISRPKGLPEHTFLHFKNPIHMRIGNETIITKPGACIFFKPDTPQWFYSSDAIVHNWAHFHPDFSTTLEQYGIPENTVLYPGDCSFISDLFRMLEQEYFSESTCRERLMEIQDIRYEIQDRE